jgi:MFS family permease
MILDFGVVTDERDTGYYAGLLAGSYSLAQFFSGFVFGILSDRISKRTIILISTFGSMVTILLFGMSSNLFYAIFFRSLNGALNGSLATAKAYLSDITDATNQAQAFSFIGLAWGIGAIGGPAIGGFLSRPARKYPAIFGNIRLFSKFPYLLPCMFTAVVMIFAFVFCAIFMAPPPPQPKDSSAESGDIEMNESTEDILNKDENLQTEQMNEVIEQPIQKKKSFITRAINQITFEVKELISIYKNTDVLICSTLYFIISLSDTWQEELFPLWALIAKDKGGLGFQTTQIGIVQMITGALMILEPLLYPYLCKVFSKLNCTRIGFAIFAILVFTPLLNIFARFSLFALGFGLACYVLLRASTEMFSFTSIFILINNAAPIGTAGRVQSFSHSIGCISRTVAPFLAGPCLAFFSRLAETQSRLFIHVPFFVITILSTISILISLKLNNNVNEPKIKKRFFS